MEEDRGRRLSASDEISGGGSDREPGALRGLTWALLLLAAAAAVVLRPDLPLHAESPDPSRTPGPAFSTAPSDPRVGIPWRPRGDLVDDTAFVEAATARMRSERPEATRLFFAGRLPDGSRLVLSGTDVNRGIVASRVHALFVPPGLPVSRAPVTEASALTDPQQVLAWAARGRVGSVLTVVLTRPGPVRFEVSARVRFDSDGVPRREWRSVYAPNGVVVTDLGHDADPILAVRATGPGVFSLPLVTRVADRSPVPGTLAVAGVDGPGYRGPEAQHLSRALRTGVGSVADLDDSTLEVLWSGSTASSRRLALVLVTRPDGRRLQALVGQQGEYEFPAGVRALPEEASDRLPWVLEPFSPQDPTLLLCPTGPGSLVYSRPGSSDKVLRVDERGVAALVEPGPSPPNVGGAEVTLRDPSGKVLLRTTLPGRGFDDVLALE